ncbi:MAG TPA: C25 family cysteine peptidase [Candidatus Fermentibacter daniensis]|nr:C25 family cysteine peptidase [Candidatus Fermentibacter daniensis]HOF67171.1 C25 family cysteine peptidase [Candidatus Fermentibacter daniensis]HOG54374.1 C25 family cysteine peptidase [Candidatus Fermentibacter daniensis]HOR07982.1 C25 family cysteine peptidase [Candidatus Fermentibacter daniensis]HOZ17236.1 C25 family cysteine peptidase [Candidatus Fermentibacter daniensis]
MYLIALIPFVMAFASGESYEWQSLGGSAGSQPVFELVESDLGHIVADVTFPGFWLGTHPGGGRAWDKVEMPGCTPQGEVGFPELPAYPVMFALPFGTHAVVTVESVEYSTFQNLSILPRQPAEIDMPHAPWPFEMNDRIYEADGVTYPETWASSDNDAIWSGLHCARLLVNPFSYDAAARELRVAFSMRVRIDFDGDALDAAQPVTPAMQEAMSGLIVNFDQFRAATQSSGNLEGGVEYVVVCTADNQSAVAPLYELHNWLGLRVKVEVLPSPSNPGAIYAAITDNYETGVTRFALIAGTHAELPSYNYGSHVGDHHYACITGSDFLPEIALGRLTGTPAQISHQVDKIIDGYLMYAFDDLNTTGIIPSETVLAAHQENYPGKYTQCCNELAAFPYSLCDITFTKVYPPEGGTAQMVSDAINSSIGTVGYRGHGDEGEWSWSPGWTQANINALTNTFMPPVFNIACYCGRYQESGNCLAESWQFATCGSSGNLAANDPSYTIPNHDYMKEIYKAIYNTGLFAVREAIDAATAATIAVHGDLGITNAKMYFWFGDPAMEIWTFDEAGEYGVLSISGPSQIEAGAQTITLTVNRDGIPVDGATVTLTDGVSGTTNEPSFYEKLVTDASGQVTFNVTIPSSGTIHAGATLHNNRSASMFWIVGVGVEEDESTVPGDFWMSLPSPNPVTTSASVSFFNPTAGRVELSVFDVTGRLVGTVISGDMTAGEHSVEWQIGDVANGVYFIRLNTPSGSMSRQVMVIR